MQRSTADINKKTMDKDVTKELEELQKEVARLREVNNNIVTALQQLVERNVTLYERLDVFYYARIHAQWLKEMVRKHREIVAHADLRDDKELMAIIDARIEAENIPLPPEFGLAELAELIGVTQTRLKDLFRKSTIYRTADKYLDNLRLLRALSLLRKHPEYSIEAISQEAGFASVRTLNRKIQETIGLTPGIYRDICNPSDE